MSGALREIIASFGIEFDHKGVEKGENSINGMIEKLVKFGPLVAEAFVAKEILEFGAEILETADALAKQSQALSVSTADLQGWQWAAKLSGSSAEEFTGAFTKFNRNVAEAGKGAGPAADAFKALGVNIKDSTGKVGEPIELLDGVADGLVAMQDPAKRTATMMALFGKGAIKLMPLFQEGAEGIKKLRAEVGELGASFDDDFLDNAQEVNDNVDRLKLGFKGFAIQALKPLLPMLVQWTHNGIDLLKSLIPIVKQSSLMKTALIAMGLAGASALLPLLLGIAPIVLGFLLLEDAITFLTGGKSLAGDLINKVFGPGSAATVQAFFKSISADFRLAGADAFAFKVKWLTATGEIRDANTGTFNKTFWAPWIDAYYVGVQAMSGGFGNFVSVVVGLAKGLNLQINAVWDDIRGAFNLLIAWIEDTFNGLWNRIPQQGYRAVGQLLSHIPGLEDIGKETIDQADREGPGTGSTDNVAKAKAENYARAYERLKEAEAIGAQIGLGDQNLDARNVAAQPLIGPPVAPTDIKQTYSTVIEQHFASGTPWETADAAAGGATEGIKKGGTEGGAALLATQAAVKKQGGSP
jgi:hypothetical protein